MRQLFRIKIWRCYRNEVIFPIRQFKKNSFWLIWYKCHRAYVMMIIIRHVSSLFLSFSFSLLCMDNPPKHTSHPRISYFYAPSFGLPKIRSLWSLFFKCQPFWLFSFLCLCCVCGETWNLHIWYTYASTLGLLTQKKIINILNFLFQFSSFCIFLIDIHCVLWNAYYNNEFFMLVVFISKLFVKYAKWAQFRRTYF